MDNKFLWAIGGLVIGYLIAKNKTEKAMKGQIASAAQKAEDDAASVFDNMLAIAESKGFTVSDIRQQLHAAG